MLKGQSCDGMLPGSQLLKVACPDGRKLGGAIAILAALVASCAPPPDQSDESVSVRSSALTIDDSNITLSSPAAAAARRQQLITFIWGSGGFPTTKMPSTVSQSVANPITSVTMTNLLRVDHLIVSMDQGMQNELYHFVPQSSNGKLVIVHQGHDNVLDDATSPGTNVGKVIAALVAEGYGVVGAFLPCFNSLNTGTGTGCPVTGNLPGGPHNNMFVEKIPSTGSTYKYFVEYLVVALNYLRARSGQDHFPAYSEFDMVGLSGGGFTTVLYAAIDPTIKYSIPCSGTKPLYLRQCNPALIPGGDPNCLDAGGGQGYDGDREQMDSSLFQLAGYLDLYALGAAGVGRRQVQVQIRHDGVQCGDQQYTVWWDSSGNSHSRPSLGAATGLDWAHAVRAYEQKLATFFAGGSDQGWFRFETDDTVSGTHQISTNTLVHTILGELDGDRRPFGAASASNVYTKGLTETLYDLPPGWSNSGFGLVGVPSVVESGTTQHVFLRDPYSSALMHLTGTQGTNWQPEEPFPGFISADSAATLTGNRLDVVAVGTDQFLYHWSKTGSGTPTLEQLDTTTAVVGTPALVATGPSRLDAFVRSADGTIKHYVTNGSGWTKETVPGAFRGLPAAIATTIDGTLRLYARGTDDTLWEDSQPLSGGSWALNNIPSKAGASGTKMAGSPSASINPTSQKAIVVTRAPNGTLDKWELVSGWTHTNLGVPSGSTALTFTPVAVPGGVFTRGLEGHVWFDSFTSGWASKAGQIY